MAEEEGQVSVRRLGRGDGRAGRSVRLFRRGRLGRRDGRAGRCRQLRPLSHRQQRPPFSSSFPPLPASAGMVNNLDMILDIPVNLTVELGRTKIAIRSLLQLAQGSVVELDGLAGEPMNVLVNGCLIAQGEVVVVNDKFGIRLTDIISPAERIRKLNR